MRFIIFIRKEVEQGGISGMIISSFCAISFVIFGQTFLSSDLPYLLLCYVLKDPEAPLAA